MEFEFYHNKHSLKVLKQNQPSKKWLHPEGIYNFICNKPFFVTIGHAAEFMLFLHVYVAFGDHFELFETRNSPFVETLPQKVNKCMLTPP